MQTSIEIKASKNTREQREGALCSMKRTVFGRVYTNASHDNHRTMQPKTKKMSGSKIFF